MGVLQKELRKASSLTLKELSKEIKLAPSTLSMLERDQRSLTLPTLNKYSEYFSIPLSIIIFLSEMPNEECMRKWISILLANKGILKLRFSPI